MKMRISWRVQFIVFIEVTLCLLMAAVLWYIDSLVFQMLFRYTEDSQLQTFKRIESEITACRKEIEELSNAVFINSDIYDFYSEPRFEDTEGVLARREAVSFLNQQLFMNPMLHSIFVRTADGCEIGVERAYIHNSYKQYDWPTGSGGVWSANKLPPRPANNNTGDNVVSLSSIYKSDAKSVEIIINLSAVGFRSLYSEFANGVSSKLFICNKSGEIISSSSLTEPGEMFEPFNNTMLENPQGSFVFENSTQIVYSSFSGQDWILVEQIPLDQFHKEINELKLKLVWLLILSLLVCGLFIFFAIKKMFSPLRVLVAAMWRLQNGDISYRITKIYNNEFGDIINTFNSMSGGIEDLMEKNRITEEQKLDYAMSALRAQINPHFLFNTINMIKWMAISQKANHIKSALDMLMILLRPLFKENIDEVPLSEEIEYAKNYIGLVNLRFGGNMEMETELSKELLDTPVPCFILQPIIENCVRHGFMQDYSQAKIEISGIKDDGGFRLIISDNGKGISEEAAAEIQSKLDTAVIKNGDRLGLSNVHMRIKLKYGEGFGVSIRQAETGGTAVIVKLP